MSSPTTWKDYEQNVISFEPPPYLRDQILAKEERFSKEMEVEPSKSHPNSSHEWELGKFIP
jgi:hypothetical protein